MTFTQLLTAITLLFVFFVCLVITNNGNVIKAAKDFADAVAVGVNQVL